ncbi:hypothetical protein ACFVVX_07135 [Kitasatospora sp. NPDC058170]|uniref:hypothetical protein n=1 Tax=Kitasatospora sp. NPDC058170 TaxID=3346364 RepID=UPI0036DA29C9
MPTSARSRPSRTDQVAARSPARSRNTLAAMPRLASHNVTIEAAIANQRPASSGVAMLKWLRLPRSTWPTTTTISITLTATIVVPSHRTQRGTGRPRDSIHARVTE